MAAKHFRTVSSDEPDRDERRQAGGWDETDGRGEGRPRHMAAAAPAEGWRATPPRRPVTQVASEDEQPVTIPAATPQAYLPDDRSSYATGRGGHGRPARGTHRHRAGAAVAVGAAVVVALGLGYVAGAKGCCPSSRSDGAGQTQGTSADAPDAGDSQDGGTTAAESQDTEASDASAVLAGLSSLSLDGVDCSLPTDGAEVDVLDGWVIVAYRTDDEAQSVLARMTSAAAALSEALADAQLGDSTTAEGGVSAVPAASTPAAISSDDDATPFQGVRLVALGQGGYVIAALSLPSADGGTIPTDDADILSSCDSYAIDGGAYAFSGYYARGIAQTKGDAPTLLTGEQIVIRLTRPQTTTSSSTSSSANASTTSGRSSGASSSSTTGTATSTSGARSGGGRRGSYGSYGGGSYSGTSSTSGSGGSATYGTGTSSQSGAASTSGGDAGYDGSVADGTGQEQ